MKNVLLSSVSDTVCPEQICNWDYLVSELTKVFRLMPFESQRLEKSTTAKIIAVLPFAANCKDAERTAIAHLCIYTAEIRGFQQYAAHQPSDDNDVATRLTLLANFNGGNTAVINHGMDMLALIMLEGYHNSRKYDKQNNLYNPLNSGKWEYTRIKESLTKKLRSVDCPLLDSLFDPSSPETVSGW